MIFYVSARNGSSASFFIKFFIFFKKMKKSEKTEKKYEKNEKNHLPAVYARIGSGNFSKKSEQNRKNVKKWPKLAKKFYEKISCF